MGLLDDALYLGLGQIINLAVAARHRKAIMPDKIELLFFGTKGNGLQTRILVGQSSVLVTVGDSQALFDHGAGIVCIADHY